MQGQDIALLLKLANLNEPQAPSKNLAESLFISPSEVSKALKRCVDSGLLYLSSREKRVNRSALMELLAHGLKYVFPPAKGPLVPGVACIQLAPVVGVDVFRVRIANRLNLWLALRDGIK